MTPRLIAIAIIVGASASIVPVAARAQDCRAGCRADTKTCVQANRVTMLACKEGCRIGDPTSVRSCRRGCTTTFHSAKIACLTDRSGCVGVCSPPSPPGSCDGAFLDTCGRQLATCARGVVARAKACVAACKTAADRLVCLQTCAQTARTDAALCVSGFDDCTAPCRPTTTTTLPHLCEPGATAGTCGGECPSGLICAPPPIPSAIALACVCQSPSGLGRCFITVDRPCSDEPCGPGQPCTNPNEICSSACLATTTTTTTLPGCTMDTECDDGNPCTADRCIDGACEHACMCLDATGATSCCPGPAALCARPCGVDASGTCGGTCPAGATCESGSSSTVSCGCVSGFGGPCGGNVLVSPPTCATGLVCEQSNPDATGKCVADTCVPFFASGCSQTSDCCSPCSTLGMAPCFVCLQGQCVGAP
jgi:hypothetical protein